jgi:hypothetical protein
MADEFIPGKRYFGSGVSDSYVHGDNRAAAPSLPEPIDDPTKYRVVQFTEAEICQRYHWTAAQFAEARNVCGFPEPVYSGMWSIPGTWKSKPVF